MPSQSLLVELSDQLFETRAWLAGENTGQSNIVSLLLLYTRVETRLLYLNILDRVVSPSQFRKYSLLTLVVVYYDYM